MTRLIKLCLIATLLLPLQLFAQSYFDVRVFFPALTAGATTVKSTPGTLLSAACYNPNAVGVWLQFFDTASSITLGTTIPIFQWYIAPSQVTGPMPPPTASHIYSAANSMRVAVTTTAGGSTAPSSAVPCEFDIR
jgi:hypothetical protein